jgi:hypothetical protein
MTASRFAAGVLAALVSLVPAPTPAADAPVRSWEIDGGPFVATATVRVGGATRAGGDARFTVAKGALVTVSAQVCGPSAECANGGPAPATSPIGTASEPSGLLVAAELLFDAGSFTEVGGGFTGEQTVGPFDTVTWSWTLRAAGSGDHVIAVQVAARRVTDSATVDGQTVEIAVQVVPTVRDFLTRRAYSLGPALGGGLAVVALITLGVVLVIRRRRMREG